MALTLNDLYATPDHYLHSFDGDAAVFVPMDGAAYRRSIFLDGRISPANDGSMRIPAAALTGPIPKPLPTSWIFHVAHCGSTLLARALGEACEGLVLREPLALRQVALVPDAPRLALVRAMLARRYRPDAPTTVKANVPVNFLLDRLLSTDGRERAVLLHLPLRDYLLAILRSESHREWLRRVTAQLRPRLGDLEGWSDAERAAALWLAQMRAFAHAAARSPGVRSLDAERFFAEPAPVLGAIARHLGAGARAGVIEELIEGPLFQTYSKDPAVAFGNDLRLRRRLETERAIGRELDQAEEWVVRAGGADDFIDAIAAVALTV